MDDLVKLLEETGIPFAYEMCIRDRDASNYLILNHTWGKQHEIRVATVNHMK